MLVMNNCPVCQRDTSPVKIGGQIYCSICGTPAPFQEKLVTDSPKRLSLDLSPRSHTAVNRPAATSSSPAVTPARDAHGSAAGDLHRRVKPSRVLDLREPSRGTPAPEILTVPNHTPAAPPSSTTHERHLAHFTDRLEKAKQISLSPQIGKFSGPRLESRPAALSQAAAPAQRSEPEIELPKLATTHHEAMTKLPLTEPVNTKTPHRPVRSGSRTHSWRPHLSLSPNTNRTLAIAAAVTIMSGYIWLQNYPKLALQNASNAAGIAASMPGYLPSSYNLKATSTSPGLVTLNFTSPSTSEALKIDQHRTTWDSSSLLDNFVAKNTDDYATVQGQGLTIYLFNNNQATWVNHGIWYSIAGAGRLSREQILKIAYSL